MLFSMTKRSGSRREFKKIKNIKAKAVTPVTTVNSTHKPFLSHMSQLILLHNSTTVI